MPQELTKSNGEIVWSASYDALGRVQEILVDDVPQPLRMQGQYYDPEIDLCYNRYRYFDPLICSFISQDPLGLAAGENIYAYGPNVWTWVDPLGLACMMTPPKKAIVIGEGMGRVKIATKDLQAQGIDAKWYQTWGKNWPQGRRLTPTEFEANKLRNKRWIKSKIKQGYEIYDIGPDGRLTPSPFYQVEQDALASHSYSTIKLDGY